MTNPAPRPCDTGLLNLRWAQTLVDALAAGGLRELVLSPGSRSTPLALAFLRQPLIRCHVVIDERSAAFFALGLAKALRQPAAVLCTSGSAPANWFPATIEASQGGTPLILISADRPPEQHGWGANQTIDQQRLFGPHVRAFHDPGAPNEGFSARWLCQLAARLLEECRWPLPGPVHLNLPFREPLLPAAAPAEWPAAQCLPAIARALPKLSPGEDALARALPALSGRPGVIVCGGGPYPEGFADALGELALRLDCPILAEPLSGLRFGPHERGRLCVRYDIFLRNAALAGELRPEWVLRFGTFPVTRTLQNWLAAHAAAEHLVVGADPRWADPLHSTSLHLLADPDAACRALLAGQPASAPAGWFAAFRQAEDDARALAGRHLAGGFFEPALLAALVERLPAGHRLFCGNSLAIRDLDAFSGGGDKPLTLYGQRGASGIDGNLSTALGIAVAGGPCVAVLGDLTAQHDLTALASAAGVDIVFVVFNNGGGGIFEHLPQAGLPDRSLFERAWLTPQRIDFAAAAAAFSVAYARADTLNGFNAALDDALARGGPVLIEATIERADSLARHRTLWNEAAAPA